MTENPARRRWGWATELETLEQLQGGDLPLATIRSLYDSQYHFFRAMTAMLHTGQLRLIESGTDVAQYRWQSVLRNPDSQNSNVWVAITDEGARHLSGAP
jgi:hypothetical protein